MKKWMLMGALVVLSVGAYAQRARVEKSMVGVELSGAVVGFWPPMLSAYYETRIASHFTLRADLGAVGWWLTYHGNLALSPTFSVGPRWYVGMQRRAKKGRDTSNNAATFLELRTGFDSWSYVIGEPVNRFGGQAYAMGAVGLRRNLGRRFTFEGSLGLGYGTWGAPGSWSGGPTGELRFRIGYRVR